MQREELKSAGILTSLLVSILGQARIYVVLGRSGLLPGWLAGIHPERNTPAKATWLTGITCGEATFLAVLLMFVLLCCRISCEQVYC